MRENRTHGSEGGESGSTGLPYPYPVNSALTDYWCQNRNTAVRRNRHQIAELMELLDPIGVFFAPKKTPCCMTKKGTAERRKTSDE